MAAADERLRDLARQDRAAALVGPAEHREEDVQRVELRDDAEAGVAGERVLLAGEHALRPGALRAVVERRVAEHDRGLRARVRADVARVDAVAVDAAQQHRARGVHAVPAMLAEREPEVPVLVADAGGEPARLDPGVAAEHRRREDEVEAPQHPPVVGRVRLEVGAAAGVLLVAVGVAGGGVRVERLVAGGEVAGRERVVGVEADDPVAVRRLDARVAGGGGAGVRLGDHPDDARMLALERACDRERVVVRAVVDDHDLVGPRLLREHALDRLAQEAAVVEARDDDARHAASSDCASRARTAAVSATASAGAASGPTCSPARSFA